MKLFCNTKSRQLSTRFRTRRQRQFKLWREMIAGSGNTEFKGYG